MECGNFKKNEARCNCTYEPCSRKGRCCDCLAYHRNMGELPACYFSDKEEKTYNRSIEHFVKSYRQA